MKGRRPNVHDELKKFKEKCNDHDLIRVSIVIKSKIFGTMSFFTNLQSSASFRRFSKFSILEKELFLIMKKMPNF